MKYEKICVSCGVKFLTSNPERKCCSSQCGLRVGQEASRNKRKYYKCQHCGKSFWKPNAFRMKYCSQECLREVRQLKVEERRRNKIPKTYYRSCAYCGKEFSTVFAHQIYCGSKCRYNAELRQKRMKYKKSYIPRTFTCKECGAIITTQCGDKRSEFCCQTCNDIYFRRLEHQSDRHKRCLVENKTARKKQIPDAFVESVSYKGVYKRDEGICQICGQPVMYDKFINDSWGATIDHIVPLSKGGPHSMDNCQLAHRICNSLKADNDFEGFFISWPDKANENNYWKKKHQEYLYLMKYAPEGGMGVNIASYGP